MTEILRKATDDEPRATLADLNRLRAETAHSIEAIRAEVAQGRPHSDLTLGLVALALVLGGTAGGFALGRLFAPAVPIVNVAPAAPTVTVQPAPPVINVQPQVMVGDSPDSSATVAPPAPTVLAPVTETPAVPDTTAAGIDLSFWKVTLPVNGQGVLSGEGDAMEVTELDGFSLPPYFVVDDTSVTFMAPTNSARTGGSNYPRSELREMDGRGDEYEWTVEEGGHLEATLRVNELPTTSDGASGRIVIGQIHGPNDELCRLYFDNGRLYFFDDKAGEDEEETQFILTALDGSEPAIALGDEFSYAIDVDQDNLVVTATYKGVTYRAVDPISAFWPGKPVYFKAGAYVQVGMEGSEAGTVGTGEGSVTFSALSRPSH
ncbi:polysaccharide lyase family 7 protein [Devosia psychrophila]|uniref:Alginate lyase n=1 Tax=Devosia psychrophila TaxID=728005 RepID=A0A1I1Q7C2_9HYPH|nr:polysaccharide lyase family 7 protein [Devosia psychrophila]SFD17872.1 Alginate lyase [Devosia psychrophila]